MIKAETQQTAAIQKRSGELSEQITLLARELKTKDESLQQSNIKIELLESRMTLLKQQVRIILPSLIDD